MARRLWRLLWHRVYVTAHITYSDLLLFLLCDNVYCVRVPVPCACCLLFVLFFMSAHMHVMCMCNFKSVAIHLVLASFFCFCYFFSVVAVDKTNDIVATIFFCFFCVSKITTRCVAHMRVECECIGWMCMCVSGKRGIQRSAIENVPFHTTWWHTTSNETCNLYVTEIHNDSDAVYDE